MNICRIFAPCPWTTNIKCCRSHPLPTVLLKFPVSVVEGANLASLQPTRYAVEMERVLRERSTGQSANGELDMAAQLTLQIPHATVHSSLVEEPWFA